MQAHLAVPTILLLGAVYTDLRARSIYNKFIIFFSIAGLTNTYYFFGADGLLSGTLAALFALVLTYPLYILKALGAGDVKLLAALGFFTTHNTILNIILISFIWASALGVLYALINGSAKKLVTNTIGILKGLPREAIQTHQLPFAVAIFLAWVSFIALNFTGGRIW